MKKLGGNGKFLPDEKKIAKPLFCRYSAPAFLSSTISNGQVSEWSNEHAWKVCVPQTGTEGSNPSLSAINFLPQYIRDGYIAVFVCRMIGRRWENSLLNCQILIYIVQHFVQSVHDNNHILGR